ncbi:MAG: hypothetical protein GY805_36065 [Chloroflexi bacterium]|nr:hypothetical protein [Chloroflexota bacterium]
MAVFFVITAVIALFLTNIFAVFADREIIKDSLANLDELMIEAVPALVAQTLEEQAKARGLSPIELDEVVLQQTMETLLPPGWIEAQTETAVDTVYDLLEGGDLENAELEIDTSPLLDRLRGAPGLEVVGIVVASLPPCTESINLDTLLNGEAAIPACIPPDVPTEQLVEEVHTRLVQSLDSNPQLDNEFGVIRLPLFSPEQQIQNEELVQTREQLLQARRFFRLAQNWGWLLWLLPVGCLLLIALLAVRSWSEWGHWWGWPLLLTAVLVFVLTWLLPTMTKLVLRQFTVNSEFMVGSLRQTAVDVVTAVSETWLNHIYLQTGIMLVAGILFVLLGFFSRRSSLQT